MAGSSLAMTAKESLRDTARPRSLIDPRLLAPQLVVRQAAAQQRVMGADLSDAALLDDDDDAGPRHKGQAVGDDHDRPAAADRAEMLLDDRLAFRVERAGRFV